MKFTVLAFILSIVSLPVSAEDGEADVPTIHLFSDGKADEEGLEVTLKQRDYAGVKSENVEFKVLIVNRLLEEVFVEVTGLGEASISIEGDAGFMSIGGGRIAFPDNIPLLKRLHATRVSKDGKRLTCGCALVTVTQSAEVDLSRWIGCTGTLSFRATGFYRSSGKRFSENIELKFNITDPTKSEQDGAKQPATAPESKPEGKEKPKPESEVRPQTLLK